MKTMVLLIVVSFLSSCCTSKCCIERKEIKKLAREVLYTPSLVK